MGGEAGRGMFDSSFAVFGNKLRTGENEGGIGQIAKLSFEVKQMNQLLSCPRQTVNILSVSRLFPKNQEHYR